MKYKWNVILECNDEDDNPTCWAAEINSDRHGRFVWITDVGDEFEINTSNGGFEYPKMVCKSLASAKRWVAMYIR